MHSLESALALLPANPPSTRPAVTGRAPSGIEVEILQKDTRATAISFGFPIEVTRSHPDYAALNVARAWLGEHRIASGQLYQRLREIRGLNYGDYAYIEAFPSRHVRVLSRSRTSPGSASSSRSGSVRSFR